MGQIIIWDSQEAFAGSHIGYVKNVRRYMKFKSFYSIKVPLQENMPYLHEGGFVTVRPGQYFWVNEGTELECLPCEPCVEALFVNFSPSLLTDVLLNHQVGNRALLDSPEFRVGSQVQFFEHQYRVEPVFRNQLLAVAGYLKSGREPIAEMLTEALPVLASQLVREQVKAKFQIEQIPAGALATRQELYRRVLTARNFMLDQWDSSLTLETVARHACLSPFHFHRTFKEVLGQSPMAFFKKIKLEKAKELLQNKRWAVTEVALKCGFTDIHTFSKAFKRVWGISPSAV